MRFSVVIAVHPADPLVASRYLPTFQIEVPTRLDAERRVADICDEIPHHTVVLIVEI